MRPLLTCLLLALALGCSPQSGAGSDPAGDAAAGLDASALHEGLAAAFAGDRPGPEAASEGDCFAEELLSTTDVAELREAGIVTDGRVVASFPPLEQPLAGRVVDAQLACTDVVADSARAQSFVTKGRLVRERYAACLRRALPAEEIRAAVLAAVMAEWGDPAILGLSRAQVDCATEAGD